MATLRVFDPWIASNTVYFENMHYPSKSASTALSIHGGVAFDAFDLAGSIDELRLGGGMTNAGGNMPRFVPKVFQARWSIP